MANDRAGAGIALLARIPRLLFGRTSRSGPGALAGDPTSSRYQECADAPRCRAGFRRPCGHRYIAASHPGSRLTTAAPAQRRDGWRPESAAPQDAAVYAGALAATALLIACSTAGSGLAPLLSGAPRLPVQSESTRVLGNTSPRLSPPAGVRFAGQRNTGTIAAGESHAGQAQPAEFRQPLVAPEQTRAVVLLYHAFNVGPDPLSVSTSSLDLQLDWLRDSGVEIVTLTQLIQFLEGSRRLPARVATVTIDDGMRSTYTEAWPILKRHRAPFTIGLPTQFIDSPRQHATMTWDQVRELVDSGLCEVASHGHAHRNVARASIEVARTEICRSRAIIERETGIRPIAYLYPLGAANAQAQDWVRAAGYRAAFGATGGAIALARTPLFMVPRTTVFYSDTVGRFAWYFGQGFLQRLPLGFGGSHELLRHKPERRPAPKGRRSPPLV